MSSFSLRSIANGAFDCLSCGNTIYDLRHTCPEMMDSMAKMAQQELNNYKNVIIEHEVNENS